MGKRSPGLWEAAGNTVRTRRTATGGGFFVADCWRKWEEPVEFAFDGNEADDNARFIAASPDLADVAHMVLTTATVYTPPELVQAATEALRKAGEI